MKSFYTLRTALVVSLGGFLFGFDASVISGVIEFVKPQFGLDDIQVGWLVSSPSLSAMVAMIASGILSDMAGRKKVLILAALLYSLSAFFSAFAPSYAILVIARMLGGFAFGSALIIAPAYLAELAPASQRGKLVSIQQFNIVIGFSLSYFSNYFLLNFMESGSKLLTEETVWRWMLGAEFLPSIIYFILMLFVPRSPRWLLLKGKVDEAEAILEKVYGDEKFSEEKKVILDYILSQKPSTGTTGFSSLFNPGMKLILIVAFVIGIVQQVTGINAILFYAPTIFEQSGVGTSTAFGQAVLVGVIQVVFTIVAILVIDRIGRKPLILIGLAGVMLSMGITAYGFSKATYSLSEKSVDRLTTEINAEGMESLANITFNSDVRFKKAVKNAIGKPVYDKNEGAILKEAITMNANLILVGILLFIASFAVSLGPVMWVVLSEIFPNKIRGLAIAIVGVANSLSSFLVQLLFPWELSNLGNAMTYSIFGIFGLIGFLMLAKWMPETKGKSLETIENELVKR